MTVGQFGYAATEAIDVESGGVAGSSGVGDGFGPGGQPHSGGATNQSNATWEDSMCGEEGATLESQRCMNEDDAGNDEPVPQRCEETTGREDAAGAGIASTKQKRPLKTRHSRSARGPRSFRDWEARVSARAKERREAGRFAVPIYCSTGWRKLNMKEVCHMPPAPMRPTMMFSPAVQRQQARHARAAATPTPTPPPGNGTRSTTPFGASSYTAAAAAGGGEGEGEGEGAPVDIDLGIPPRPTHKTRPIHMHVENEPRQWRAARHTLRHAASAAAKILNMHTRGGGGHHHGARADIPASPDAAAATGDEDAEPHEFTLGSGAPASHANPTPTPPPRYGCTAAPRGNGGRATPMSTPTPTPPPYAQTRPASAMSGRSVRLKTDAASGFETDINLPYDTRPDLNSIRHVYGRSKARASPRDPFNSPSSYTTHARPASAPLFRPQYNERSRHGRTLTLHRNGKPKRGGNGDYAPPSALCKLCKLPLFGALVCRETGQFHFSDDGVRLRPVGEDDLERDSDNESSLL